MTKQTIISAGYRLTVESWENDADNHNTKVMEGLTFEQCNLFVDLCKLMEGDEPDVANLYEPDEDELQRLNDALVEVARRHPTFMAELEDGATDEDINDAMMSILHDLGLAGGDFTTRVCSEWKVELVPVQIVLTDVTEEFK